MTSNSDFKALVRRRMTETGQTYTQARASLLAERPASAHAPTTTSPGPDATPVMTAFERARREHQKVVSRFIADGVLLSVPVKRKARASVLLELVAEFEPGREYTEVQVNRILESKNDDYAYLRRELVNYGYLTRADGVYTLPEAAPTRDAFMAQEIPEWERLWLPGYLAGAN